MLVTCVCINSKVQADVEKAQTKQKNRYAQCVHASTLILPDAPQCGFTLVKTSIEDFLQITMVTNIGILIIIDKVRSHSQKSNTSNAWF